MPDSPHHPLRSALQARRNPRVWVIATALLIVLAAGGLVTWQIATRPSPIHIAFANSLSGAVASEGTESLTAAQLYVDEVNRAGGVDGHEIVLDPFDDRSSAKGASDNVQAIADGPALAVLGHLISPFSIAAASGYKAARIPALTSQSVADELTIGTTPPRRPSGRVGGGRRATTRCDCWSRRCAAPIPPTPRRARRRTARRSVTR